MMLEKIEEIFSKFWEIFNSSKSKNKEKDILIMADYFSLCGHNILIELLIKTLNFGSNEKEILIAILKGDVQLAESSLKKGVKLGHTIWMKELLIACIFLNKNKTCIEILKILMQHGLNVHGTMFVQFLRFVNKNDQYAVDIAEFFVNLGLSVHDSELYPRLSLLDASIVSKNVQLVSFFIKKGADVNKEDLDNKTVPLLVAADRNVEMVNVLLSNGADVNAKNIYGETALHFACIYNDEPIIAILLQNGADISPMGIEGNTPFSVLYPEGINYDRSVVTMIKEFASITFENRSVCSNDMDIVEGRVETQKYFENFMKELDQMKNKKFFASYSFYCVLKKTMGIKKLSNLVRNEEIGMKFEEDVPRFSFYEVDLQRVWEEAINVRDKFENICSRLRPVFGDLLSSVVIRNLANYLTLEDLPIQ